EASTQCRLRVVALRWTRCDTLNRIRESVFQLYHTLQRATTNHQLYGFGIGHRRDSFRPGRRDSPVSERPIHCAPIYRTECQRRERVDVSDAGRQRYSRREYVYGLLLIAEYLGHHTIHALRFLHGWRAGARIRGGAVLQLRPPSFGDGRGDQPLDAAGPE